MNNGGLLSGGVDYLWTLGWLASRLDCGLVSYFLELWWLFGERRHALSEEGTKDWYMRDDGKALCRVERVWVRVMCPLPISLIFLHRIEGCILTYTPEGVLFSWHLIHYF